MNYTFQDLGPGNLTLSANYVYRSATYYDIFEDYRNKAKADGQTDLRALYIDNGGKDTVIASMKKVFDQRGLINASGTRLNFGPDTGFVNQTRNYIQPRLYSLELQVGC